jgi:uncharacterized protein (TIGR03118 family)
MNNWDSMLARVFAAALIGAPAFAASNFVQHNLVADIAGVADNTDPNLVGSWGISASPASRIWVSNTAIGLATEYNTAGVGVTAAVIPPSATSKLKSGLPTGQVWSGYGAGVFEVAAAKPANFIFATLDGTISGNNGGTATIMVDNGSKGAVYTGLGIGVSKAGPTLYAANFGNGTIDTFDKNFTPVALAGSFFDPDLPAGYAPINNQRFGQRLYVTYGLPDGKGGFVSSPGAGWINAFDLNGNLVQRLVPSTGNLNVPWGLALAGPNFGVFSYALIVGNFGDGSIVAFDPVTGDFIGAMQDGKGNNLSIEGLWGLQFGSQGSTGNANGGDATTLYFTAAPSGGAHGLFGALRPAADSVNP